MELLMMTLFRFLLLVTCITGFSYGNTGIRSALTGQIFQEEKQVTNIAQFIRTPASTSISASSNDDKNYPDNLPTTMETAKLQLFRLLDKNVGSLNMSRRERFLRISVGWSLLLAAKSAALASPLYFRALVNQGKLVDNSLAATGILTIDAAIQTSAIGLIIGYGSAKLTSGFVQLICELILSSATVSAAETLPKEAFTAALTSASRRWDDGAVGVKTESKDKKGPGSGTTAAAGGQDEGRSGFARRALDRGLRASNQLLYRSIFNLLPAFVETICVVVMMIQRAGMVVGLTAAVVAYSFVGFTMLVMKKRIPILRRQLRDEGIANGCAEDALSLAETVASFGAIQLEEARYATALARVSRSSMRVRYSFSLLKLMQSMILGVGAGVLIFVTWRTSTLGLLSGSAIDRGSLSGQLVLVQSLFAQLCAPLDHVGQHFRDCVSAAEDLRDLETLKRVLTVTKDDTQKNDLKNINNKKRIQKKITKTTDNNNHNNNNQNDHDKKNENKSENDKKLEKSEIEKVPKVFRQFGGREAWLTSPPRLEIKDLIFSYPSVTSINGENRPILNNISFSIPAGGHSLGIVGPSGSGKSTILRVLLGLEPIRLLNTDNNHHDDDDEIGSNMDRDRERIGGGTGGGSGSNIGSSNRIVDSIASYDIPPTTTTLSSSLSLSEKDNAVRTSQYLRFDDALPNASGSLFIDGVDVSGSDRIPCFSLAGQDSDLFRGLSLVDNIRYGTHTAPDSFEIDSAQAKRALENAADDAQLDPLLQRLQGGWEGAVGPRGRLLSGGERQRVCLARALYREELNGGILLMDEVTASLDAKTESLVTNAVINRVRKGATAVLIAHRLSTVQHCDLVIVMKDGVIIERGTHAQLIKRAGWYAESWKLQSQSR